MKRSLCLALLFLTGCAAQIEQKMKTTVLLSPESLGQLRIEAGIGAQAAPMATITDDVESNPPDRSVSRIEQQTKLFLHGGLGVLDRIDLSLDPASWLNAKFQLLGEPFSRAEKGNFSLSLLSSVWYEKDDGHGSDWDLRSSALAVAPDVRYSKTAFSWRGGVLMGYRLADPILLYTGVHHQEHRYRGSYDIVNGAKGRYAGFSTVNSASLGLELQFGKAFVIRLEDAYSLAEVKAFGARSSQHSVGLLVAGTFGLVGNKAAR